MIKLFVSVLLAIVTSGTIIASAHASSNTTDQQGREYQDIRNGRYDEPVQDEVEVFDPQRAEEQYLNSESDDPGHYDGKEEEVIPPSGCPSDLESDNDDDILRERAREYQKKNSGN
jgi:hypothetical protein